MSTATTSSNTASTSTDSFQVDLGEGVEISTLGVVRQTLEHALVEQHGGVVLDGERVARIDGAALQLFAAFCREAKSQGCEVRWKNPSSSLQRAARLLGLSQPLGLIDADVQ